MANIDDLRERLASRDGEQKTPDAPKEILYKGEKTGPGKDCAHIDRSHVDAFERIAQTVPGTFYHEIDPRIDRFYPAHEFDLRVIDKLIPNDGSTLAERLGKNLKSYVIPDMTRDIEKTGRATLGYNNGLYCYMGYRTVSETDHTVNTEPVIYLFSDHRLARALENGIEDLHEGGYVPGSNGERRTDDYEHPLPENGWNNYIHISTDTAKENAGIQSDTPSKPKGRDDY